MDWAITGIVSLAVIIVVWATFGGVIEAFIG